MKYHTLFFRKLEKMSQNLSSAAVVIEALRVKLPFVFKTFVLSIVEWPLKTGFTVTQELVISLTGTCQSTVSPSLSLW